MMVSMAMREYSKYLTGVSRSSKRKPKAIATQIRFPDDGEMKIDAMNAQIKIPTQNQNPIRTFD